MFKNHIFPSDYVFERFRSLSRVMGNMCSYREWNKHGMSGHMSVQAL